MAGRGDQPNPALHPQACDERETSCERTLLVQRLVGGTGVQTQTARSPEPLETVDRGTSVSPPLSARLVHDVGLQVNLEQQKRSKGAN